MTLKNHVSSDGQCRGQSMEDVGDRKAGEQMKPTLMEPLIGLLSVQHTLREDREGVRA